MSEYTATGKRISARCHPSTQSLLRPSEQTKVHATTSPVTTTTSSELDADSHHTLMMNETNFSSIDDFDPGINSSPNTSHDHEISPSHDHQKHDTIENIDPNETSASRPNDNTINPHTILTLETALAIERRRNALLSEVMKAEKASFDARLADLESRMMTRTPEPKTPGPRPPNTPPPAHSCTAEKN